MSRHPPERVEGDARRLLAVLAGKVNARGSGLVSAGPEDAAAGFGTGQSDERLHRAVWRLISEGLLEAAIEADPPDDGGPRARYRITRGGVAKAQGG